MVNRLAEVLTRVDSLVTELLLNAEDLVELGETLRSGRSTGLDLASTETDSNVGDGDVLSLTGSVRDHDTPAVGVRVLGSLDGLGQGTNLVDLEKESVARLELDGLLDAERVGDSQIITDNLDVLGLGEVAPSLPVVLSEGVLDGDDGVLLAELRVHVGELLVGDPLGGVGLGVLEVEIVLLLGLLVELTGGDVHGNLHLAGVASLLNGVGDELESLLSSLDIRGNTTLVTDVAGGLAVSLLGKTLKSLVDLSTLAESLRERHVRRDNHELLEGEAATSVGTTVEDVHEGNGEDIGLLGSGEVGDVSVQRNALGTGLGNGQRNTKDGVGTKLGLVGGTIELVEESINSGLVLDIEVLLNQSGGNDGVDVLDSLGDTLAVPLRLVAISELASLVLAYMIVNLASAYGGWTGEVVTNR
ncbi:hypothetical protein HG531_013929 [Fusarium graminearum]|nr:hypothetical protein HG531_013929 [Fusarium graminearum]